ncbi:MAG: hypothetical protein KDB03_16240 [Planctomycetales bacterium]|nr:hypothetical protein [Planctomycetales bacterium]
MSRTSVFGEFCRTLEAINNLKPKEQKAIRRAASGVFPDTLKEDREVARSCSIDTDLRQSYTHSECVSRVREVVQKCDLESLTQAFIAGLHPDRIRWRAPLQAFAACRNLPTHRVDLDKDMYTPACKVCGVEAKQEWMPVDLAFEIADCGLAGRSDKESVEPFEAAVCLEWFLSSQPPEPTKEDEKRLQQLIEIAASAPANTTAVKLVNLYTPVLGGDKYAGSYLVETLGLLGILVNPQQSGDFLVWTNWSKRAFGTGRNQEMLPPACGWRREFGLDANVLKQLFPNVQFQKLT